MTPQGHPDRQDGGAYYQRIALKNDSYRFSERARRTVVESTLADLDVERDDRGHLAGFHVLVRAEPERWLPAPEGGQAAALPGSRSTSYLDIDGDSVLDQTKRFESDQKHRSRSRQTLGFPD
jgi:hypothetical protein